MVPHRSPLRRFIALPVALVAPIILIVLLSLSVLGSGCHRWVPAGPVAPMPSVTAVPPTVTAMGRATVAPPKPVVPTVIPATATPAATPTPELAERLYAYPMPVRAQDTLEVQSAGLAASPLAQVGDVKTFWVVDFGQRGHREIMASLQAVGEHVQMWVQEGVTVDLAALEEAVHVFDTHIYPTVREAFGSERTPGIDGDPRLVVLNAQVSGAAGYFAASNSLPRSVNPYSNEHEMFIMNIDALHPGSDRYHTVLAHEFQHMIHWYQNPDESAWVNEGASQLAEQLSGYDGPQHAVRAFARQPDLQLNTWSVQGGRLTRHYGAVFLFVRYFYERYGPEALRALVAHAAIGMAGFDAVLAEQDGTRSDDLVADWVVANLLNDPDVADGRYAYNAIEVRVEPQTVLHRYPFASETAVAPYSADYYAMHPNLTPEAPQMLRILFEGATETRLVPTDPPSGRYLWWSNRGDWGHAVLERRFDLSDVTEAELTFDLWHDIEYSWDYAGVRVSTDDGETWTWLAGEYTRVLSEGQDAPGPVYTGRSGVPPDAARQADPPPAEWVRERLDLTPFAGQAIILRFDKFTDDAVNEPGLCLDNFALEAIGYHDDVEGGEGGWQAHGFLRHDNLLPVTYQVQLVTYGTETEVRSLAVRDGHGEWFLPDLGGEVEGAALVVLATVPLSTEPIPYILTVELVDAP